MFQVLGNFFSLFGKKDNTKEEEKIFALGEKCREEEKSNEAFEYYVKAAEMGHAAGIFNAGVCYSEGYGVEKDARKAFEHFQKSADIAAEQNNAEAIYDIGECYGEGFGVEKDEDKARTYMEKAGDMGFYYANKYGEVRDLTPKCVEFFTK
ncbi:calmodulin-dependent protein kinase [Gigaspora margarita]|uniref:Calmodulin-dependent protein kinase n=1 Tax=Gigaspora margarita TaxID=4874 RepID=A0A8H4AMZ4_GIGMA|nr:calmodulin-dependent protein kinase [Gigaspora margarita]